MPLLRGSCVFGPLPTLTCASVLGDLLFPANGVCERNTHHKARDARARGSNVVAKAAT